MKIKRFNELLDNMVDIQLPLNYFHKLIEILEINYKLGDTNIGKLVKHLENQFNYCLENDTIIDIELTIRQYQLLMGALKDNFVFSSGLRPKHDPDLLIIRDIIKKQIDL